MSLFKWLESWDWQEWARNWFIQLLTGLWKHLASGDPESWRGKDEKRVMEQTMSNKTKLKNGQAQGENLYDKQRKALLCKGLQNRSTLIFFFFPLLSTRVSKKVLTLGRQKPPCRSHLLYDTLSDHILRQCYYTILVRAERVILKRGKNEGGNIQTKRFLILWCFERKEIRRSKCTCQTNSESIRIILFSLTKVLEKREITFCLPQSNIYSKKNAIILLLTKMNLEHIETENWVKPENESKKFFISCIED